MIRTQARRWHESVQWVSDRFGVKVYQVRGLTRFCVIDRYGTVYGGNFHTCENAIRAAIKEASIDAPFPAPPRDVYPCP